MDQPELAGGRAARWVTIRWRAKMTAEARLHPHHDPSCRCATRPVLNELVEPPRWCESRLRGGEARNRNDLRAQPPRFPGLPLGGRTCASAAAGV